MEYLNKIRETVSNVAASVTSVLPGNPITREFEPVTHVASAGPGLIWKIYSGYKKSNGKDVSIWFFDKKVIEKWFKSDKDVMYDCLKRGISQLTRLRHPHLLTVEHPLEESRDINTFHSLRSSFSDTLAFCTEPVFASLANVLGRCDNMPPMLPPELIDFHLEDIEIRHGLSEILKALSFLHSDIKMLHRNICPESILITKTDCWKLAGFEFCISGVASLDKQTTYPFVEWDEGLTPYAQPPLNYLAPEVIFVGRYDPAADIYSLGVLIYSVYNKGSAVNNYGNSLITRVCPALESALFPLAILKTPSPSVLRSIPDDLKEDFKMCLLFTSDLRPDAVQLAQVAYFRTDQLKVLQQLESLCQCTIMEKVEFLKLLDSYIEKFSKRLALWKLLSYLSAELEIQEMVPLTLPRILDIAKRLTKSEFRKFVLPLVISTLSTTSAQVCYFCPADSIFLKRTYHYILQVQAVILSNIDFLFSSCPEADAKKHLLPFLYTKLDSDVPPVLDLCCKSIPNVHHLIDKTSMKTIILPKLLHLATDVANISVTFLDHI
ncbi:unnamed protein product [Soboliphyme baturini]|uniref:Protein kinase domain-containing protein n=1 Tax=Soboliphyme baturini TaxID=241478 RepID=A0A183IXK1_9BILA|nr:unnamed protein product [Soboliphyme baturini]